MKLGGGGGGGCCVCLFSLFFFFFLGGLLLWFVFVCFFVVVFCFFVLLWLVGGLFSVVFGLFFCCCFVCVCGCCCCFCFLFVCVCVFGGMMRAEFGYVWTTYNGWLVVTGTASRGTIWLSEVWRRCSALNEDRAKSSLDGPFNCPCQREKSEQANDDNTVKLVNVLRARCAKRFDVHWSFKL